MVVIARHEFRIEGEPRPWPKDNARIVFPRGGGKPFLQSYLRDYRTRKNPTTGDIEAYDHGYMMKWYELVRSTVLTEMKLRDFEPFPKKHPLGLGCLFFITRSKSCKLFLPSQVPDEDNLDYGIRNILKRTPAKTKHGARIEGPYPDGVLFYDDDQIVWREWPAGMLWATPEQPPGVIITVQDLADDKCESRQYIDQHYRKGELL